ncbi:uncharacterized protein LOC117315605 [Pecten maximus]|uniref:uncharacterized protein LOC117315605 n=1 Tax=Pecten maximus TaxID=6579 RepID=UPI00145861FD|nr:uncharacterized protein LOC117315605 [Pecten maximus]
MSVRTIFPFLFVCLLSELEAVAPQTRDQSQHLVEAVAAIDQKLTKMERQLIDKDVRIRNLETTLENHIAVHADYVKDTEKEMQMKNLELNRLQQLVTSLTETANSFKQTLSETSSESRELASRMSVLEQAIFADGVNAKERDGQSMASSDIRNEETSDKSVRINASNAEPVQMAGPVHKAGPVRKDATFSNSESTEVPSEASVVQIRRPSLMRAVPSSSIVAFHYELSNSVTVRTGSVVVYDHETLDEGHGYSPHNGIYTVPVAGIYVMVWDTFANFRSYIQTFLVVNGTKRGTSFSDAQATHDLVSSLVVLRLQQGDRVVIQVGRTSDTNATMSSYGSFTAKPTFSGWKLF